MPQESNTLHEHQRDLADLTGKYLTFEIGDESYGLQILRVQEIIKMQEITKIPRTPEFVEGVINLRGRIMPVIDMRKAFGMEERETSRNTCIIIVEVQRGEASTILGVVVDRVAEVLEISAGDIEPAPSFGAHMEIQFILGMAKSKDSVNILLDTNKIVDEDMLLSLEQARC